MAKIVQTQYRENYGAHDGDGTGECPQHWKNKGGSTYVVVGNASDEYIDNVIQSASEYSEEYIIHRKDVSEEYLANVDKEASIDFEPWEDRTYIYITAGSGVNCYPITEVRKSGFEDLRRGLASYTHTWEYASGAARTAGDVGKYSVQYVFKNGMIANSEEQAREIFEHLASRVTA